MHNEIQQAIEYLALPTVRTTSEASPARAFVTPNRLKIRLPIVLESTSSRIAQETLNNIGIPLKPFIRVGIPDIKPAQGISQSTVSSTRVTVNINARIPTEKGPAPQVLGEIEIDFLIAAK